MKTTVIGGYCVLNNFNNTLYASKAYKIYKSLNYGKDWILDGVVDDPKYSMLALTRLGARLFRAEITDLLVLKNGERIIIAKKGIFVCKVNSTVYKKVFSIPRGTRPLNLCEDGDGAIYFGEYLSNKERGPVHVYKSIDSGVNWDICYTFEDKWIRHVHGIFYDHYENKVWFATGDLDNECIIGSTDDGFKTIDIFKEGKQKYRTVQLFFYKDFIVYGTDTEYEKNFIYKINRHDKVETCIIELQGSVLSGSSSGDYAVISTAVEPSEVNKDVYSHVWFSKNGIDWTDLCSFEKDMFSKKYFQYGRVKFPRNAIVDNKLFLTGHALKKIDNKTLICDLG